MANKPNTPNVISGQHAAPKQREMLIECTQYGSTVRVAAVDVLIGTEVTFQAPLSASQATIQRIAADKLKYVMGKK